MGVGTKIERRASQVVQGLRICLTMQGTWVRSLTQEDPSCHGTAGPMSHNLLSLHFGAHESQLLSPCSATAEACAPRAQALQQEKLNCWAHVLHLLQSAPRACALQQGGPLQWEAHALQLESGPGSLQLEKACTQQRRISAAKNNK